jgi:hypothetical protein
VSPARVKMVTVEIWQVRHGRKHIVPVLVPRVSTYGTFTISEILPNASVVALAEFANWMERSERAHKSAKKRRKAVKELVGATA